MEFALKTHVKDVVKFFKGNDKLYPLEMREHVQGFIEWVRNQTLEGDTVLIEERVELPFLHKTEAFGTVDVAIIEPFGRLHIIDFKYGQGFVDHNNNSQMSFYALGLAHKLNYDIEDVAMTIYQPRAGTEDPARTSVLTVKELLKWRDTFQDAINKAEGARPAKLLNPGEHCKWCPAKVICPEISKKAMSNAKLDFSAKVQPGPRDLSPQQLKDFLDRADYLELWVKEVKAYAEEVLRKGQGIPGWGLRSKRAVRRWYDVDKMSRLDKTSMDLFRKYKIDLFETKKELRSFPDIEKELKKKKVPKDKIAKFLKDYVVAVSSGVTLSRTNNDFADVSLETNVSD